VKIAAIDRQTQYHHQGVLLPGTRPGRQPEPARPAKRGRRNVSL